MAPQPLVKRVDALEAEMSDLRVLAQTVTTHGVQISQLRTEMRAEFSALRQEIQAGDEETRRVLREEIRAGDEETRRAMRVLHEDVISRIALLQEGLVVWRRPSAKTRKRKR